MKPFAGGSLDNGKLALKFLKTHQGVIPIPGFEVKWQVDEAVEVYSMEMLN